MANSARVNPSHSVTPKTVTPPATTADAQVQMRSALRGQGYDAQVATLTPPENVQAHGGDASGHVHEAAARGTAGSGAQMPHLAAIQRSFGGHDVGGVQAHVGGAAREATQAMGAEAYASGNHVAFGQSPDLHTAAHEAAHVIQQKAGVSLEGGVGRSGDTYERQADAVADRVVQGKSAEDLLGGGGGSGSKQVQKKGTQLTDVDLPAIGLTGTQIDELSTGFGGDDKLQEYITALGGNAKLKELVVTKGLGSAELQMYGGAAFFSTFVGCGTSTIDHVKKLDGIEGGAIKGCHDEDIFKGEVLKKVDFTVQDKDLVTKAPLFEPVPQVAQEKYDLAVKKYQGQLDFYNGPKNDDGKGGKKMKAPPSAPAALQPEPKMVTLNLERGRINSVTALSVPGVNNMDYELRRNDTSEWRNSGNTKTTIKDLASNAGHWQSICNEAIWDAIKNGTFGKNWSGATAGGATIDGYWNGGAEVDTFFFTS
jgi:hypothetical protein